MLWLLIAFGAALLASVIGLGFDSDSYYYASRAGDFFWFTLIPLGIVAIALNIGYHNETRVEFEEYYTIQNMGDSNGTEGHFALFGGSIDNQPVYMYYVRDDSGRFTLHHVNASEAYVTYSSESPKVVWHKTKSGNNWLSINPTRTVGIEFRVPEGSVKQNFNLDAQ